MAGGRKVKMISLEGGGSKQPVPKEKLVEALYPTKKIATTATLEEKHFNAVKAAMRRGVEQQLREYKATVNYPIECLVTGRRLIRGTRVDVDHHGKPFSQIADEWVNYSMLNYTDVVLSGPPTGKRIKDDILWESWKEWHREHARFAIVCASANRSKGAAGYATPIELIGSFKPIGNDEIDLDF
jgi:Fe-S cluster biosynthesis and repair protein YggX